MDKGYDLLFKRVANLPLIGLRLSTAKLCGTLNEILSLLVCLRTNRGPRGFDLGS